MAIVNSGFEDRIAAGLDPVVIALQETFNGEDVQPGYSFRNDLGIQYSFDGTYKTMGMDNGLVAADIIALDSPLPVKSRPAVQQATGLVPKIGTERFMNETDRKQLRTMIRSNEPAIRVNARLFNDVRHVYGGVLEQIEWRHLQGQSQGFFVADHPDNVGLGVRVDYGYRNQNLFNANIVWGQPGYTAVGDLVRVIEASKVKIARVRMNVATKNLLLASPDASNLVADVNGAQSNGTRPTLTRLNEALQTEYGFVIEVVDRSIRYEINGVFTDVDPWATGQVIFLQAGKFGDLVWSDVEEMHTPVGGVNYSTAEQFILISQYAAKRPSLRFWTDAQAVALPVINGYNILKLDTTTPATT
ncbi:MAG: hypothetical protein LBF27_25845 [Sphingobacterium sp.]|jgi:hypothetical protein|nr:hypothetical protein [Sphingobacterium sp.]